MRRIAEWVGLALLAVLALGLLAVAITVWCVLGACLEF